MQACHASIKHHLKGLRLNVEYLIGSSVTGIQYKNLRSFFQIWGIWDNDTNTCLSWDETTEYAAQIDEIVKTDFGYKMPNGEPMGMPLVPVLFRGPFSRERIESLMTPTLDGDELEGLVVRVAGSFPFGHSAKCVGKYVRAHHEVRHGGLYIPNLLAGSV